MRLADLVELEARIASDAGADEASLRQRDREIFGALEAAGGAPRARDALLSAWLQQLDRRNEGSGLGLRIAAAYRWLAYGLVIAGLALGWSTGTVLLDYDGTTPVNVASFLLVAVGVQLAALALLFLGLPLARFSHRLPVVGDVRALLRWIAEGLEARVGSRVVSPAQQLAWQATRARLRTRASLYHAVEAWLLLGLSQLFAVAFNVALLACCLRLIVFSDLAFAWSTTLDVSAAHFHRAVELLAAPFGWLVPSAVPDAELVELTRYSRLEGAYHHGAVGRAAGAVVVGGWWPFLIASIVAYGLLPRVVLLSVAIAGRIRALSHLPLETPDVDRIVRRLRSPTVRTQASTELHDGAEPATSVAAAEDADVSSAPAVVIAWRDAPLTLDAVRPALAEKLGLPASRLEQAGAEFAADAELCARLGTDPSSIVVVAEAWESPDKSVRHFLRDLRAAVGPKRRIFVLLSGAIQEGAPVPPEAADVAVWRDRLSLLQDPYLGVEAVGPV